MLVQQVNGSKRFSFNASLRVDYAPLTTNGLGRAPCNSQLTTYKRSLAIGMGGPGKYKGRT